MLKMAYNKWYDRYHKEKKKPILKIICINIVISYFGI